MSVKEFLLDEDRGVSPVIGVILMVAITVILAAVIATFVMNMGPSEASPPNAQFTFEQDSTSTGDYVLVHDGGEAVSSEEISTNLGSKAGSTPKDYEASEKVIEGLSSGAGTLTITWENPNNDETQVLFEDEVPS